MRFKEPIIEYSLKRSVTSAAIPIYMLKLIYIMRFRPHFSILSQVP